MQRVNKSLAVSVWTIAAGLALSFADVSRANLVGNPGFETQGASVTDPATWVVFENGHTADRSSTQAHSGSWSMYFNVGPDNTNPSANNANVNQTNISVGPIAGQPVEMTGWAFNPVAEPLAGTVERVELRIWFDNAAGSNINFVTSTVIDANSPVNTWIFGSVSGIAPAGTEKLRGQIIFRTDPTNQTTGSAYVDDITLAVIPEPGSLATLALPALGLLRRRRR